MRRRMLLVALAGLAVVIAIGVVVRWPRSSRATIALMAPRTGLFVSINPTELLVA
jgi:hypothetical protein